MSDPTKGQILPGSAFGEALTALAREAFDIVELGTWHGLGSTKCLANGLHSPAQRMWTVEPDPDVCKEAQSYYGDSRITFFNGTGMGFYRTRAPQSIDLILFDGDDLETDAEFDALSPRCKVVCLDDTRERKNRRQRETILRDPATWTVLHDEIDDRNGWMIAKRRDCKSS